MTTGEFVKKKEGTFIEQSRKRRRKKNRV